MNVTALIVEHVLSGVQAAFVLALAYFGIFGVPATFPVISEVWAVPFSVLGLAIVYPLGIFVDEVSDFGLSRFEKRIKRQIFRRYDLPEEATLLWLLVKQESAFLAAYLGYVRTRIRIARSTALNMLMLTLVLAFVAFDVRITLPMWMKFSAVALSSALCVVCLVIWRKQVYSFYSRGARVAHDLKLFDAAHWPQLAKACQLACEYHGNQVRKGSDPSVPYLSHLFGVTELVLNYGGDDCTAAAAMLHDSAEDQGGQRVLDEIATQIEPRVAELVRQCSDTLQSPKPQ